MTTLEKERIHLGEITNIKMNPFEQAQIDMLNNSDSEILKQYDVAQMKEAVRQKLQSSKTVQKKKTVLSYSTMAMAAAVVCALFIPLLINNIKTNTSSFGSTVTERVKGAETNLFIYRNENGKAHKLTSGSIVNAGDVLQISYLCSKKFFGTILSVDGNGYVTEHFPESGKKAVLMQTGGETPLEFSYKLDNAPNFERFFLISSDREFSLDTVESLVKQIQSKEQQLDVKKLSEILSTKVIVSEITLVK